MMERKLIHSGGILDYDPEFLSIEESNNLFSLLKDIINWEQKYYTNYKTGQKYPQPRLTAWFADSSFMIYSYSGVTQKVQKWTPELLQLKKKVEEVTKADYNSVLLNYYRHGQDSVGMHADDEKELGVNANIASVSLGETRRFVLSQYRYDMDWVPEPGGKYEGTIEYMLNNGSLLVMSGTTQHYWKHEIPKMVVPPGALKKGIKPTGSRINLTFRKFKV